MLRQWILTLVYFICFIPGNMNYADLMTKALGLEPFRRYRDALLSGRIVFPSRSKNTGVQSSYVARLSQYLQYSFSLPDVEG